MKSIKFIFYSLIILLFYTACKKEETKPIVIVPFGAINLKLNHKVDGNILVFDTIKYNNLAQNNFSISRIEYYLSNIQLVSSNKTVFQSNQIIYVDAKLPINEIIIPNIPVGNYESISFNIGIDALNNIHEKMPSTPENIGMQWPTVMGGGYHFLKFEGQYFTLQNDIKGFAIHIGLNTSLIAHQPILTSIVIEQNKITPLILTMNMNEWFKNPYTYNLNVDGNYTMGDSITMKLITNNGKDVFYEEK